jgi:hypothetical protein
VLLACDLDVDLVGSSIAIAAFRPIAHGNDEADGLGVGGPLQDSRRRATEKRDLATPSVCADERANRIFFTRPEPQSARHGLSRDGRYLPRRPAQVVSSTTTPISIASTVPISECAGLRQIARANRDR